MFVCYLKEIPFPLQLPSSCGGRFTTVELFQLLLCISVTPSEELGLTRAVLHTQPTITEVLGPDEPREVMLIPTRQLLPTPTAADLRKERTVLGLFSQLHEPSC